MEPRIRYVKTEDGVSIAYWAIGEGPPLICLPPFVWSHLQLEWQDPLLRAWYEELAKNRQLVRFDFRGQGLSERKVADLSFEAHLRDLDAVADHLEIEKFALSCTGPNTPLTITYAARNPQRVSHLIHFNPQMKTLEVGLPGTALLEIAGKDWETYTEAVAQAVLGWSEGDRARAFAEFIRQSVNQETWTKLIEQGIDIDAAPLLSQVSAPTLVLARPTERRVVDASRISTLASQMRNARVVFLSGTSPVLQDDDAGEGLRAIDDFLRESEEANVAPAATPSGLVTILFTDMESSTALRRKLGDAKVQELVRTHNEIVRDALKDNGGSEIKHTGDGIMASFPTATSALQSSIAIQQGVASHVEEHPDSPLAVYIGLNAGEPIAEEQDLFGTSVDLARRICDHAEPGQILASNVVRELAEGKGFLFGDIGDVVPKGFEQPVRLYEVRWGE